MPPGLALAAATRSRNVFTFDCGDVTSIDADLPITPIGVSSASGSNDCLVPSISRLITIGLGLGDGGRADVAARSRAILDDHLLAELVAKLLRDEARNDVGRATGSE